MTTEDQNAINIQPHPPEVAADETGVALDADVVLQTNAVLESGTNAPGASPSSLFTTTSSRVTRAKAKGQKAYFACARPDELPVPDHGLFYGIINDCIEQLVIEKFGRLTWHAVKEKAGPHDVEDGDFQKSQQYDQDLTYRIVGGITEVTGLTPEQALEATGQHFISTYLVQIGYLDLLRSQGKTLRELMSQIDNLHAHLKRDALPNLAPPCFRVQDTKTGVGFHLHYWSFRPGLAPLVRGMVKGCGVAIFDEHVDIETVTVVENEGTHYVLFLVTPSDQPQDDEDESEKQPSKKLERHDSEKSSGELRKRSFSFFDARRASSNGSRRPMRALSHSNEVGTLVLMLKNSVARLETEADVEYFQNTFNAEQLCRLLELKSQAASEALQALFREPFSTSTSRVPHSGFLSKEIAVREYQSVTTHRAVYNRFTHHSGGKRVDPFNPPLADQLPRRGLLGFKAARELKQIKVRACFLKNILQLRVLRAIAHNPNMDLFETEECQAIIHAAWEKVRPRFLFDVLLDVLVLFVMTMWKRTDEHFALGVAVLWLVVVKELLEECWCLRVHFRYGLLSEYPTLVKLGAWGRMLLMSFFCVINSGNTTPEVQRPVYAMVVLLRWMLLLYTFRAFTFTGPKLLPLMYTFKSMGSFFLVLVFYIAGFIHAFWALSSRSWYEVFEIVYRLGVMADFNLDERDDGILEGAHLDGWLGAWFFFCSALLTLFMMNVVISVLGESYDVEQERAQYSFLHSRALLCVDYLPRMKRSSRPLWLYRVLGRVLHTAERSPAGCCLWLFLSLPLSLLYFLQRVFICEWHVFDHMGDKSKDHDGGYLWFCTAVGDEAKMNAKESRLLSLKHHTQSTVEQLGARMDKSFGLLQSSLEAVAERVDAIAAAQHDATAAQGASCSPRGGLSLHAGASRGAAQGLGASFHGQSSGSVAAARTASATWPPPNLHSGFSDTSFSASAAGGLGCPFSASTSSRRRLQPAPARAGSPDPLQQGSPSRVRASWGPSSAEAAAWRNEKVVWEAIGGSWHGPQPEEDDAAEDSEGPRGLHARAGAQAHSVDGALALLRCSIDRVESLAESLRLPSGNV